MTGNPTAANLSRKNAGANLSIPDSKSTDMQTILDHMPFIISRFDRTLRHLYVNAAVEHATGIPPQRFIGKTNRELGMPAALCAIWETETQAVFTYGAPRETEFEFLAPDGLRVFHARLVPEFDADGTVVSVLSTTQDITDLLKRQRQAEAEVSERDAVLNSLYDSSPMMMGVVEVHEDNIRRISVNSATTEFYGATRETMESQLATPQDRTPEYIQMWLHAYRESAHSGKPYRFEYTAESSRGTRWLSATACPIRGTSQTAPRFSFVIEDITEQKLAEAARQESEDRFRSERKRYEVQLEATNEWLEEANEQLKKQAEALADANQRLKIQTEQLAAANALLEELATTDGLTGLKNHRAFQERFLYEIGRGVRYYTPLSLLLLDVDHFKLYNDTYGHPAGDQVLKTLAQIISETLRDTDFVARYGGEEFAVLLPGTDGVTAFVAAERIRMAVANHDFPHRRVTLSIGVAALEHPMDAPEQLLHRADAALYISKSEGRNRTTCFGQAAPH